MGLISLYVAASLDGAIAGPHDELDWLPEPSSAEDYGYPAYLESVDALVMGSRTYEVSRTLGEWPYEQPAYVFSRRRLDVPEPNVAVVHDEPVGFVRELGERLPGRVWVVGGARIAGLLLDAGVVRELVLTVIPVVLGEGIGLFDHAHQRRALRLQGSESWPSGVVQLTYDVE